MLDIETELVVFGDDYPTDDGSCVRDYLHVMDLAEAHVAALNTMKESMKASMKEDVRAFNLGTGRGTSVLEVILRELKRLRERKCLIE